MTTLFVVLMVLGLWLVIGTLVSRETDRNKAPSYFIGFMALAFAYALVAALPSAFCSAIAAGYFLGDWVRT